MKNETFCPAPWTSIYVDPIGRVDNCCLSKNNLGNLQQSKLDDLVNSTKNKAIKKMMEVNLQPSGCAACHNKTNSFKQIMHKRFESVHDESFYDNINNFQLNYADLRFRNTCNYACIYCGPVLSSLWASELSIKITSNENNLTQIKDFFEKHAETLKEIYLAGGEPFLIKENEHILEVLLEKNPNILIYVNTNLSSIDNKIFNLLHEFNNVVYIVSVDDIEDRYNYIRWPGNWDNFISNLLTLKNNLVKNHSITFAMVYNVVNCKTIFSCIELLINHKFIHSDINIMYVNNKPELDPRNLGKKNIDFLTNLIYEKIEQYSLIDLGINSKKNLLKSLHGVIHSLHVPLITEDKNKVIQYLEWLDEKRKINSKLVFPEIYSLLNNI